MFVRNLQPEQAMIFVYSPPQHVGMWMKNTLIPLDMLFVDADGCVVKVHEQAEPGALETIASEDPVVLVVELAGGVASQPRPARRRSRRSTGGQLAAGAAAVYPEALNSASIQRVCVVSWGRGVRIPTAEPYRKSR